jgi:hypothetical protein
MTDEKELAIQVQSLGPSAFAQASFQGRVSPLVRLAPFTTLAGEAGELGRRLCEFLFPAGSELDRLLDEARRTAAERAQPLRIRLRVNETCEPARQAELIEMGFRRREAASYQAGLNWMAILPWEWLGAWLAQAAPPAEVSIVREILPQGRHEDFVLETAEQARGIDCQLRLLAAWADPQVEPESRQFARTFGEQQTAWIEQLLAGKKTGAGTFPVVQELKHATLTRLSARVQETKADVVHLITHGEVDSDPRLGYVRVLLEDDAGHPRPVDGETLGSALCGHGWRPQLVVLHVCQSATTTLRIHEGVAPALIRSGVPRVIGMQAELGVAEAADFAEEFFGQLAESLAVDRALLAARGKLVASAKRQGNPRLPAVLGAESLPAWVVPVLFMHPCATSVLRQGDLPPAVRWPTDGKVMILVRDGKAPFYVDKYPVTCRDFARQMPNANPRFADLALPMFSMEVEQAEGYAARVGKRLPQVVEWMLAATGGGDHPFPWGMAFEANRCNSREYWQQTPHPRPVLQGFNDGPTPVATFRPQTAAGICDLVGNVAELARDADGTWRRCGGSFSRDCSGVRLVHENLERFYQASMETGFRTIAAIPDLVAMSKGQRIDPAPSDGADGILERSAT